jgi:hypothetical protein
MLPVADPFAIPALHYSQPAAEMLYLLSRRITAFSIPLHCAC